MKYQAPYSSTDPNAGYVDRSTPNAQSGSKVPKQAVEHPQREIVNVITAAGLTPSGSDLTQLEQAIGVMLERLRVNLPIYPQVENGSGKLTVTAISPGIVRIPAGQTFVMRGGKAVVTVSTDLSTVANTTYHLRWTQGAGFIMKSLTDMGYNSSGNPADETDAAFDSTYDDMLVARIVTNGSNVATITTLVNRAELTQMSHMEKELPSALIWTMLSLSGVALNWARTPRLAEPMWQGFRSFTGAPDGSTHGVGGGIIRALEIRKGAVTRYAIGNLEYWYEDDASNEGYISYNWMIEASRGF